MEKERKFTEYIFGIPVFAWDGWDSDDEDSYSFYHVHFDFESMVQYNDKCASLTRNGFLKIYDEKDDLIYSDFVINIPEYQTILRDMYGIWSGPVG